MSVHHLSPVSTHPPTPPSHTHVHTLTHKGHLLISMSLKREFFYLHIYFIVFAAAAAANYLASPDFVYIYIYIYMHANFELLYGRNSDTSTISDYVCLYKFITNVGLK